LTADLYLDRIRIFEYLAEPNCQACGFGGCKQLVAALKRDTADTDRLVSLGTNRAHALRLVARPGDYLPEAEVLQLPAPTQTGVFGLNDPTNDAPLLVTGNSEVTLQVLTAVLATTTAPFRLLLVDTRGDTVDMAMIYESLTAEAVAQVLRDEGGSWQQPDVRVVLPGLAAPIQPALEDRLERGVEVGPVCAAELPLYFADRWTPPTSGWSRP